MGLKRTNEFRQDAVRIALTSGLTQKQVETANRKTVGAFANHSANRTLTRTTRKSGHYRHVDIPAPAQQ